MGVQIIKDIKINQVTHYFNCCSKDLLTENNSNEINVLTKEADDKLQHKYSNKIAILSPRSKIKNTQLNKNSDKNISLNTYCSLNADSEPRISKIMKIQSFIRGILLRKKLLENHILAKSLINIKNDNNKEDKLDTHCYIEESLISKYNNYIPLLFFDNEQRISNKTKTYKNNSNYNLNDKNIKYKYLGYYKSLIDDNKNSKIIKNGFGIIIFSDNTIFKSNFKENKATGFGHYIDKNNIEEFIGEYENNIRNGFGIYTINISINNNHKYYGYFNSNGLNGIGIEESNECEYIYYGEFLNNKKHGYGTLKWNDGTIYEGHFDKNQINGYAIINYPGNKVYKGKVNEGKLDGFGEFLWPEGKKYCGYYKNDKKDGFGIFFWDLQNIKYFDERVSILKNIKAYVGFWNEGYMNGFGLRISDGIIKYGLWKNGKKMMWIDNVEHAKNYFKNNQKKYLKIMLENKKDLLNLLIKSYKNEFENYY